MRHNGNSNSEFISLRFHFVQEHEDSPIVKNCDGYINSALAETIARKLEFGFRKISTGIVETGKHNAGEKLPRLFSSHRFSPRRYYGFLKEVHLSLIHI